MARTVEIGAPSLTGKSVNTLVAEAFGDAKFPLKIVVENFMPRNVAFPEAQGLFLRHVANATETRKTVEITSLDLFHRFASSVEQIAQLNRYPKALVITQADAATDTSTATTAKTTAKPGGKNAARKDATPAQTPAATQDAATASGSVVGSNAPADGASGSPGKAAPADQLGATA